MNLLVGATIVGFAAGCALGAACNAAVGLLSLALPAGTALIAFAFGFSSLHDRSAG
jgi:hypothetical protein